MPVCFPTSVCCYLIHADTYLEYSEKRFSNWRGKEVYLFSIWVPMIIYQGSRVIHANWPIYFLISSSVSCLNHSSIFVSLENLLRRTEFMFYASKNITNWLDQTVVWALEAQKLPPRATGCRWRAQSETLRLTQSWIPNSSEPHRWLPVTTDKKSFIFQGSLALSLDLFIHRISGKC